MLPVTLTPLHPRCPTRPKQDDEATEEEEESEQVEEEEEEVEVEVEEEEEEEPAAAEECAPRNLASVFNETSLLPRKRRMPEARDVVRTVLAASRARGLPAAPARRPAPGSAGGAQPHADGAEQPQVERMQVVLRVRPPKGTAVARRDVAPGDGECLHALSGTSVHIAPPDGSAGCKAGDRPATFSFSRVFAPDADQKYLFRHTARNLVLNMVGNERDSAVVMTYGITSSGKTYTMEGTASQPGLIVRSVQLLFAQLEAAAAQGKDTDNSDSQLTVRVSLYEVYNDCIYDLLNMPDVMPINKKLPTLKLKEDAAGHVYVAGLAEVAAAAPAEALDAYHRGIANRHRAETQLNLQSSRSHCIFTVTLCAGGPDGAAAAQRLSSLSFVDLAGSERAARTGNAGQSVRMREMVAINSSLMTLGRCMEALRWNQLHPTAEQRLVPYRESKVFLVLVKQATHVSCSRALERTRKVGFRQRAPPHTVYTPDTLAPALAAHTTTATATDKPPGDTHSPNPTLP